MRKLRFRWYLLGISLVIAVLAVLLLFDRILIYAISKPFNVNISYSSLKNRAYRELFFRNLRIVDTKHGIGLYAKYATLTPSASLLSFNKDSSFHFELKDVHFVSKNEPAQKNNDALEELVLTPFKGNWSYHGISGDIRPIRDGIRINNLTAGGDDIRLSLSGTIHKNNTIESSITIYFSEHLPSIISDNLPEGFLQDEEGGWKSLTVALNGDLSSPSIQVTGKMFRLTINSK